MMQPFAKILIVLGVLLIAAGVGWQMGWIQYLKLGKLPGDMYLKLGGSTVYFPLTTCLIVSAVVGVLSWIFRK